MGTTWLGSMRSSLIATLAHPEWWAMALAGFLVRGGIVLILLPIVSLPTPGQLANALAPTIDVLAFEGLTVPRLLLSLALAAGIVATITAAGLAGAWFDLALMREAATDEDLDLRWHPGDARLRRAFLLRVTAHVPTMLAISYATVRLIFAAYEELLSPGDPGVPLPGRVIERAPEALVVVALAWLAGESVGGMAVRRAAMGQPWRAALGGGVRQLLRARGVATLGLTTAVGVVVVVGFLAGIGGAWEHLRSYLFDDVSAGQVAAALLVLVASWILGIAVLGAALAWRATAWTAEVQPAPGSAAANLGPSASAESAPEPVAG
jgi:hypothetical protein